MKKTKLLLLLFCLFMVKTQAQDKGLSLDLSLGYANPIASQKSLTQKINQSANQATGLLGKLTGGPQFNLDAVLQLGDWGIGSQFGQFRQYVNMDYGLDLPTEILGGELKSTFAGLGPNFTTQIGKTGISSQLRAGLANFSMTRFSNNFLGNDGQHVEIIASELVAEGKNYLPFASLGLKLSYPVYKKLRVFTKADYFVTFGEGLHVNDRYFQPVDINQDGSITATDVEYFANPEQQISETRSVLPQIINFGAGLSYTFGGTGATDGVPQQPPRQFASPVSPIEATEKVNQSQERQLIARLPANNSRFRSGNEIQGFSWELLGPPITNPQYIIEVVKVNAYQQAIRTYAGVTSQVGIGANQLFKGVVPDDGQYRWSVRETSTGLISNTHFFFISSCEIDFQITNDSIECLGYEDTFRRYKVCFDSEYFSPSGDLTYSDASSDLTVFDQDYTPLSYTLVAPNPTLVMQTGATFSTETYCFEVLVGPSVTSIGWGLQGDDLDPGPIVCRPGVSAMIDELPDCLCNDCDNVTLSFDEFTVSSGGTGKQFDFNGDINVNIPIYGIEFQIQSYSYTAAPSACTEGVHAIEESGMILMPGTMINGVTALQLFNENVSGSPDTNNDATKDIKYSSDIPISGPIPVNLTIGLPGPLEGLSPDCCLIDYTVCVKVKVFYEDGSCKSCDFKHCFEFNNQ